MAKRVPKDWPTRVDGRLVRPGDSLWSSSVAGLMGGKAARGRALFERPSDPAETAKDTACLARKLRGRDRDWPAGEVRKVLTESEVEAAQSALRNYGFDALWPRFRSWGDGPDPRTPFDKEQFEDLRSLLHPRLNRLRHSAATAAATERALAVEQLKEILAALVPDQRGKGKGPKHEHNHEVWVYFDELLRWQTIPLAMPELAAPDLTPGFTFKTKAEQRRERIEVVARLYEEPVEDVRLFIGLDDNFEPRAGRPQVATQRARTRAAQRLGCTETTLQKRLTVTKKNAGS
jgi:hypothetical protein